jgi:hypothetical protein
MTVTAKIRSQSLISQGPVKFGIAADQPTNTWWAAGAPASSVTWNRQFPGQQLGSLASIAFAEACRRRPP